MKDIIVIYQMGKVGSSSLYKTINKNKFRVIQIHRFFLNNYEVKPNLRTRYRKIKVSLYLFFVQRILQKRIKIITGFRDPLPRNISSFFQSLHIRYNNTELSQLDYKQLIKDFNLSEQIHDTPNTWFDLELKRKFGVDIYNYPFNKENGFVIIQMKNVEVFVYTLDKLNSLENEIAIFLNVESFKIIKKNIATTKRYSNLYNEFKKYYKAPEWMIKKLYNSRTINYFFNDESIKYKIAKNKY